METAIVTRREEEGYPPMRVWDFSSRSPVMIVTTAIRRVWHIDPECLDPEAAEKDQTGAGSPESDVYDLVIRQVAQSVASMSPEERWDDDVWRSTNPYTLLSQPELPEGETDREKLNEWLMNPLRHKVYTTFNHVFWDGYNALKEETDEVVGEFAPPSTSLMMVGGPRQKVDTCRFDTDTFVYPIWIMPGTRLIFEVDGHEQTYEPEGKHWTFTLWFRAGEQVTITSVPGPESESESSVTPSPWSAVLALGLCKPRPLPRLEDNTIAGHRIGNGRPWRKDKEDGEDGDGDENENGDKGEDMVESWPEAVHLARAIFLKAGHAIDTCTFDDMDIGGANQQEEAGSQPEGDEEDNLESESPLADGLYAPLPDDLNIRLLVIEPAASVEEQLRTRLEVIHLDSTAEYEAISYSWGHPSDKVSLLCNDESVMIPRNLEAVLKRLRRSRTPRRVWADSVCINQNDIPERGQQVSIMRLIYQRAKRVVSWLGVDEQDQAHAAFSAVCGIVRTWRPEGPRTAYASYDILLEPMGDEKLEQVHKAVHHDAWDPLRALFENTYFRRFWIIQELALGDSAVILWGNHHISWGLVGTCAAWAMTSGWHHGYSHKPLKSAFNAFLIYVLPIAQKSGISMFSRMDLSAILGMTMGFFDATDARDRIYALLGMVFAGNNPDAGLILQPDYSQSVPSVYTHAARRILEHDQHLRILSTVQHGPEIDTSSYPSWVPRWDQPLHAEPLALQGEQGYYANGGELFCPSDESFSSDGLTLNLKGLLFDTVTEVTDEFHEGEVGFHVLNENQAHVDAMKLLLGILTNETRQLRASWSATLELFNLFGFSDPTFQAEALASDKMRQALVDSQPGKYGMRGKIEIMGGDRAQTDHLAEFLLYWRERASWDVEALRHPSMRPFWNLMDQQTTYIQERATCVFNSFVGRRIFFLEDGTPGLGPAAMRPGDVVAVLFGGIVPFILRPVASDSDTEDKEGEEKWQLVGECFMPHLMQGEAVEKAGLLEGQGYGRESEYFLKLTPETYLDGKVDPRFERKVGENSVRLFQIC